MMNKSKGIRTKPKLLMSFNGGENHMAGNKSIELAYINPNNKEAELFDLSFDDVKGKHLSNKNPESCMNCHGELGKTPPGGAKLIFDIFNDWHRFVGGVDFKCSDPEDRLRAIVEDKAVSSVKSNPQYDCLDKSKLAKDKNGHYPKLSLPLVEFDNGMKDIQTPQRTKWLQSIPENNMYKYLNIGYSLCGGKITEWVSPEVYRKNVPNLEIDPRLKNDGNLVDVFLEAVKDEDQKVKEFRKMQAELIRSGKINFKAPMEINRSSRACIENKDLAKEEMDKLIQAAKTDNSKHFSNRDPLVLLQLDSYLRAPRFQSRSLPGPPDRFMLEGGGYGTFMIQKSFRPGELVHGGRLASDKEFAEIMTDPVIGAFFHKLQNSKSLEEFKSSKNCEELKALSRGQFERAAKGNDRGGKR